MLIYTCLFDHTTDRSHHGYTIVLPADHRHDRTGFHSAHEQDARHGRSRLVRRVVRDRRFQILQDRMVPAVATAGMEHVSYLDVRDADADRARPHHRVDETPQAQHQSGMMPPKIARKNIFQISPLELYRRLFSLAKEYFTDKLSKQHDHQGFQ
jgi:hypothetical protein